MGLFNIFSRKKTVENVNLEKVMLEMSRHPDMKVRRVLYSELLKSILLLPTPGPLEASSSGIPLKEVQLVTQPGTQNEVVWIVFTNRTALQQWRHHHEDAYIAIQGSSLFALAVQNRVESILINPAGPIGGKITRMELQMLAEGTFPGMGDGKTHTIGTKEQTSIRMGTPVEPLKPGLAEYLHNHLVKNEEVLAGYVAAMIIGRGKAHLILGIEFVLVPHKNAKPIMDAIALDIHALLGDGEYLDMVPFDINHEWNESLKKFGILVYRKQ